MGVLRGYHPLRGYIFSYKPRHHANLVIVYGHTTVSISVVTDKTYTGVFYERSD